MNRPNSFADLFHPNGNGHPVGPRELAAMRLALNSFMARGNSQFARQQSDPRRDVDDEAGYPRMGEPISVELYRNLYEREAIAARVVEVMPQEVWSAQPTVYEDEDAETITDFEGAWDEFGSGLRGEQCWFQDEEGSPVWDAIQDADEKSGIGHYGLLFIGFDDGQPFATPIGGVLTENRARREVPLTVKKIVTGYTWQENEQKVRLPVPVTNEFNPDPSALYGGSPPEESAPSKPIPRRKGTKVLYLRAVPEYLAQVVQYEVNPNSPRFGLPVRYVVTFADPRTLADAQNSVGPVMSSQYVHWTRVIHFAENTPRMRPVLNNLLSLRKIYAADGETFFRNCALKIYYETHPELAGDVLIDKESIKDQHEAMMNGLQQWMALSGMSAKAISPAVVDPGPHVNTHLQAIAIKLGMPMRVLMGTERGELAGGQDEDRWDGFVRGYRTRQATPKKIVPLVDRLIAAGVLPEPRKRKSGPTTNAPQLAGPTTVKAGGYCVSWPEEESQTPAEKANVLLVRTQAMAAYEAGATGMMTRLDWLTREVGHSEEEATSIIDAAKKEADAKAKEDAKAAAEQAKLMPQPVPPQPDTPAGQQPKGAPAPGKPFPQPSVNAFCPTGPGGGVDPTCAPVGDHADPDELTPAEHAEDRALEKKHAGEERELERRHSGEDSQVEKDREKEDRLAGRKRDREFDREYQREADKINRVVEKLTSQEMDKVYAAEEKLPSYEALQAAKEAHGKDAPEVKEARAKYEADYRALLAPAEAKIREHEKAGLAQIDEWERSGKFASEHRAKIAREGAETKAKRDREDSERLARQSAEFDALHARQYDERDALEGKWAKAQEARRKAVPAANANPEGCNQHTGPGCGGGEGGGLFSRAMALFRGKPGPNQETIKKQLDRLDKGTDYASAELKKVPLADVLPTEGLTDFLKKSDKTKDLTAAYKSEANKVPPIAVLDVGGKYVVYDGHHRYQAAVNSGNQDIHVLVLKGSKYQKQYEESHREGKFAANAFCPTGEGGGVDPSCPPVGSQGFDRAFLSKEIGTRSANEVRDLQRRLKLPMTGKKSDLLAGMEAKGVHSLSPGAKAPAVPTPGEGIGKLANAFHAHPGAKHNLVPLADLKDASGLSTPDLHAAIQHLRREGVLSASAIEGRHGSTERERGAAILEEGTHLGFVSVREGQEKRFRGMTRNADVGLFRRFLDWLTGNTFCPTGPGGGIDATCSPGGGTHAPSAPKGPVTFKAADDRAGAVALARETHGEWGKSLSPDQRRGLEKYVSADYKDINSSLRQGRSPAPHNARFVEHIDSAIASAPPLPHDAVTYRGVGATLASKLAKGVEFTDNGYTSTSIHESIGKGFAEGAVIHLKVPKGTKAAAIDAVLDKGKSSEHEYILPRGSRYKVTGVKKVGGKSIITAELLP